MPNASTLKEAKAAYKARGRPQLSDLEQRQLAREAQLERRAWGLREREKHRGEAARRKSELGRQQKAESVAIRMGSQRRCDKFGYKSSQFHLGAFFGKGPTSKNHLKCTEEHPSIVDGDVELDFDGGVDDESLLEAMPPTQACQISNFQSAERDETTWPPATLLLEPDSLKHNMDDLLAIWDDFPDSSTQIARELDSPRLTPEIEHPPQDTPLKTSFDSNGSFSLTDEDLAQLDPVCAHELTLPQAVEKLEDNELMPPPAIPPKRPAFRKTASTICAISAEKRLPPAKVVSLDDWGISLTQLEEIVDDDIVLTQR